MQYNEFLSSIKSASDMFKKDVTETAGKFNENEDEFKKIKKKTVSLIKHQNMPKSHLASRGPRSQISHVVHTSSGASSQMSQPIETRSVSQDSGIKKRNRVPAPCYVTHFQSEKFTPFRAHANNTILLRNYQPPPVRQANDPSSTMNLPKIQRWVPGK